MRHDPLDRNLFIQNRQRLRTQMLANGLAALNANDILPTSADGSMAFHQNPDLYYLSGITQEETILLIYPDAAEEAQREILFLRRPSEHLATWEGHKLSQEEARERSGIETVMWLEEFRGVFHRLMCECEHVYLNSNEHKRAVVEVETRDARFVRDCRERYPLHQYHRLARVMHRLRAVKSELEIDLIRKACALTGRGFRRVLGFARPGIGEWEVEAELAHEFLRSGSGFAGYQPIIASGANACTLHYQTNHNLCRDGDLLLLDFAAEWAGYQSDLTRTIPVNGRFTRRQRSVYEAVLRVFREASRRMVPGKLIRDLQKETEAAMQEELLSLGLLKKSEVKRQKPGQPALKKYFMHGVAHPLGLDVHDVGLVTEPIEAGWLLTCEPGIYIKEEGLGVRLENDILVTETGPVDLMAEIPIEADAIEELMNRGSGRSKPRTRPSKSRKG
ncbi:MAG TPA: aminopeptidase P N-terminal domain-containing protein [Methylomirabilota bacterium]|nr:aminopeptidase P N-terminal domain-containing protein [Methylomirabilota bacterium]